MRTFSATAAALGFFENAKGRRGRKGASFFFIGMLTLCLSASPRQGAVGEVQAGFQFARAPELSFADEKDAKGSRVLCLS